MLGDVGIRIDRNGVWHHQGAPFRRPELVSLFASVLSRDGDGRYWLTTPAERAEVVVEDAPFLAVELFRHGCGREQVISLRTNIDEIVTIDGDHPLRIDIHPDTGEPAPYVALRDGLEARINRPVFYEMVNLSLEEKIDGSPLIGLWSRHRFFPLGPGGYGGGVESGDGDATP